MPILNFRTEPAVLTRSGPLVPAILAVSDAHRQILARRGEPAPDTIDGFALIDTGASGTCVDQEAAAKVGLPVIDRAMMNSASHAKHEVPVYSGKLVVPEFIDINMECAMGASLDGQNLIALIGRDLLQAAVLVYNGMDGTASLSL